MKDPVNAFLSPFSELPEEKHDFVSCLTVDFAMQNVLLKMNLGRIGVDGRQINSVRKYVLRCTGCFYVTIEANLKFVQNLNPCWHQNPSKSENHIK